MATDSGVFVWRYNVAQHRPPPPKKNSQHCNLFLFLSFSLSLLLARSAELNGLFELGQSNGDCLDLSVVCETVFAELATNAALLVATYV